MLPLACCTDPGDGLPRSHHSPLAQLRPPDGHHRRARARERRRRSPHRRGPSGCRSHRRDGRTVARRLSRRLRRSSTARRNSLTRHRQGVLPSAQPRERDGDPARHRGLPADGPTSRRYNAMPERDRFVRGMVAWTGFQQIAVPYRRAARFAGESKYPLFKMVRFALDGLTSFSRTPLRIATRMGFIVSAVALAAITYALVMRLFTNDWVTRWTALFIAVLFVGGAQTLPRHHRRVHRAHLRGGEGPTPVRGQGSARFRPRGPTRGNVDQSAPIRSPMRSRAAGGMTAYADRPATPTYPSPSTTSHPTRAWMSRSRNPQEQSMATHHTVVIGGGFGSLARAGVARRGLDNAVIEAEASADSPARSRSTVSGSRSSITIGSPTTAT